MTAGPPLVSLQPNPPQAASLRQRQARQRSGMGPAPPPDAPPYGYTFQGAKDARWSAPLPPILYDATTSKFMVPSRQALYAILVLPLLLWTAAVLAGMVHMEPLPEGSTKRDFEHPLSWFDRHVFRVWGPLLPLAPYLVRVAALGLRTKRISFVCHADFVHTTTDAAKPGGRPLRPGVTLPLPALLSCTVIIVVRMALYALHVGLQRSAPVVLVSDHLLLAASVVACFQSELLMCLSDAYKAELLRGLDHGVGERQVIVVAAMVTSMFVLVFVCGDMYCTARWYHDPAESLAALVAGAVAFQVPVVVWLLRRAGRV